MQCMARRFQRVLLDTLPQRQPWEKPTAEQLTIVAAMLGESDVFDIIAELDAMSLEKAEVPDWDGDTQDDIARAQETLAALLAQMAPRYREMIVARLHQAEPLTRQYLELALR